MQIKFSKFFSRFGIDSPLSPATHSTPTKHRRPLRNLVNQQLPSLAVLTTPVISNVNRSLLPANLHNTHTLIRPALVCVKVVYLTRVVVARPFTSRSRRRSSGRGLCQFVECGLTADDDDDDRSAEQTETATSAGETAIFISVRVNIPSLSVVHDRFESRPCE